MSEVIRTDSGDIVIISEDGEHEEILTQEEYDSAYGHGNNPA